MRHRFLVVLPILILAGGVTRAQQWERNFALTNGDRVVLYGDSITNQKLYTSDVEEFVLTRFPEWKLSFIHSGVDGDKVSGGAAGPIDLRLERDVFAYHPNVVTVMLGMNDGYYLPYNPGIFSSYVSGYRHIVEAIRFRLPDARLTLLKPSPYNDVTPTSAKPPWHEGMPDSQFDNGYNAVLQRFGVFVGELANEKHAQSADFNTPVVKALIKAKVLEPGLSAALIPDCVHPGTGIHWLIAEALLKAWGATSVVTSVTLDATTTATVETLNAQVTQLNKSRNSLSWLETDQALPLPLPSGNSDPFVDLAIRASDLVDALDQEVLRVKGLTPGNYQLTIDDKVIETFGADQLASGINLALLETPMLAQSRLVAFDRERKNEIETIRFGLIQQPANGIWIESHERQIAADKLSAAVERAGEQQHKDAQPVCHRFTVTQWRQFTSCFSGNYATGIDDCAFVTRSQSSLYRHLSCASGHYCPRSTAICH
jgi:lysophospholipase L1-like esterase